MYSINTYLYSRQEMTYPHKWFCSEINKLYFLYINDHLAWYPSLHRWSPAVFRFYPASSFTFISGIRRTFLLRIYWGSCVSSLHAFKQNYHKATPGWNWWKIRQKLRNSCGWTFVNLKLFAFFIHFIIQK